jgi:hypothetical protein
LKKRSKKLLFRCRALAGEHPTARKSFLALFCKKELLACLLLAACGDLPRPFAGNPGRRALQLSVPPPPQLLVPAPTQALLPAHDAEAWAHAVAAQLVAEEIPAYAKPGQKGQWVLVLSASLQGEAVVPHYALIDPSGADKGDVSGHPLPAADWAGGAPQVLAQSAAEAAPQVLALLRSVDASIKQSDPNSLYNRPARVYFTGVTGAPGDGDRALTRGMRVQLPQTGDQLVDTAAGADFTLRGTVKMTDEPSGEQQVEIHWLVIDARGVVVGDVAQGHDVARGSLDHLWGDVAGVVTEEAAGGVHDVITNYSGRKKKA